MLIGANETILGNFRRNSRATGPVTREPIGKLNLLIKHTARIPKRMKKPPHRRAPTRVRTTTAVQICPFLTSRLFLTFFFLGIFFLTTTRIISPISAKNVGFVTILIHLTKIAPELSATRNILSIGTIFF